MPSVSLDKKRVLELIGKKIEDSVLKEAITYMGTDLESIEDGKINVEIFPNRPDLMSDEGLARAVSSFLGIKKGLRKYAVGKSEYAVNITKEVGDVRPYTACAVIKKLKLDAKRIEGLVNIQEKLHITHGRNRKRCAIGMYPLEHISFPITYTALPPQKIFFRPLGSNTEMDGTDILKLHEKGKEYAHLLKDKQNYPVFLDANNEILSMPPIINSEKTGRVDEDTTEIFVECSGFDFNTVSKVLNILCAAFFDMKAEICEVALVTENSKKRQKTPDMKPEKMVLDTNYARKIIGAELSDQKMVESLQKMGYAAKQKSSGKLEVLIPPYRCDILHEIDLIEDIAIGYGYNNIEEDTERPGTVGKESFEEKVNRKIRHALANLGLVETVNFYIVPSHIQKELSQKMVMIKNSMSSDYDSLRASALASVLLTLENNKSNEYPQKVFDLGKVFSKEEKEDTGVKEENVLCVAICSEDAGFTSAKQHLMRLAKALDLQIFLGEQKLPFLIDGRAAIIRISGENAGYIGELSPNILSKHNIIMPVCCFELNLSQVYEKLSERSY